MINSPAIIVEATGTNMIETGWLGRISKQQNLILEQIAN